MPVTDVKQNNVEYGLCNVFYSLATYNSETEKYTYATPKRLPGAVTLTLSAVGQMDKFYADNIAYYTTETNGGYEGDIELANLPNDFRTEILGAKFDDNGILLESSEAVQKEFALLFQFEGDVTQKKHILYRCASSRPEISSSTKEDKATYNKRKLSITAMARKNDKFIKGEAAEGSTNYAAFFDTVQEPSFAG